jgi:hypothetical protein
MNINAPADRWAGLPRESQSKANVPNNLGQQFLEYQKSLIHSTIVSILFKYIREANPLLRHKDKDFNIVLLFLVYLVPLAPLARIRLSGKHSETFSTPSSSGS